MNVEKVKCEGVSLSIRDSRFSVKKVDINKRENSNIAYIDRSTELQIYRQAGTQAGRRVGIGYQS